MITVTASRYLCSRVPILQLQIRSYARIGTGLPEPSLDRMLAMPGMSIGGGMPPATQAQRERDRAKGQAMAPSSKNKSNAPRFPIERRTGPNSLASAIHAVGRARPNTDEERAKVRRYIMRVAARKGWSADIPSNWNSDGSIS